MSKTRLARIAIPIALILIWLVGAAVGGPYFGRIEEVATNDQATFLPTSAEATVVSERYLDFVDTSTIPAIVLFTSDEALTPEILTELGERAAALADIEGVEEVSPLIPSEDGKAAQVFAEIGRAHV